MLLSKFLYNSYDRVNEIKKIDVSIQNYQEKISLTRGQISSIIGPNGIGKTTFLRSVLGLDNKSFKTNIVCKTETNQVLEYKKGLNIFAYVPQFFEISQDLFVSEIIELAQYHRDEEYLKKIVDLLEISHLLDKKISFLSGGEKSLVNFARALYQNSAFVAIDEVESSLDLYNSKKVYAIVKKIATELNKGVIIITHDPNFILNLSNNDQVIYFLKNRKLNLVKPSDVTTELLTNIYNVPLEIIENNNKKVLVVN
ncbi:MAG: ATP-binding cassette domain-containing protein [Succinivibrionaceae bacterium]